MKVGDHAQEAGFLGVDVGVLGLLVTLGDAQVERKVLCNPGEVLPQQGT